MHNELIYELALNNVPKIGNVLSSRLLRHFKSAKNVFDANENDLLKVSGIGTTHIQEIKLFNDFSAYENEISFIEKEKLQYQNILSNEYETNLKECIDAPLYYFSKGNFSWENRTNIAIVGTRQMTNYGKQIIDELLEYLADFQVNIISGFAYGVDIYTHKKCIELNIPTIGILAHGFDMIYPKIHKKFIKPMLENGGFITEYKSSTQPERENFLQRNRIIAGLSKATLIVESAFGGGAITTANYAFNYDREVFAAAGKIQDIYSQGCNALIKKNIAQIYTEPSDFDFLLDEKQIIKKINPQKKIFVELNAKEQKIFDYLSVNGKTQFDSLSLQLDFTTSELMNHLLVMEFNGIITQSAGKYFEI